MRADAALREGSVGYDPQIHHRRSGRAPGYDYGLPGWYFLTICTHHRRSLFGEIHNAEMYVNALGRIVEDEWQRTAEIRQDVTLDAYIIMPNHIHGIVVITVDEGRRCSENYVPQCVSPSRSVGAVVRGFKAASSRRINALEHAEGRQVWQRNYYDHIIRNEADLERIRSYIETNPGNWSLDREHPDRFQSLPVGQ